MADRVLVATALDLEMPNIIHPREHTTDVLIALDATSSHRTLRRESHLRRCPEKFRCSECPVRVSIRC